jgi:hypothetical protein
MTDSAVARSRTLPRGLRGIATIWFPLLGPIGAWTVHALFIAGVGRLVCTRSGAMAMVHLVTATTLLLCLVAIALSVRLMRRGTSLSDADTDGARARFLGLLGITIGLANVLLIVAEELFAVGLHPVRCLG